MRRFGLFATAFSLLFATHGAQAQDEVPAELLGTWIVERPTPDYCADGRCTPSYGGKVELTFESDGWFFYGFMRSTLVEGCGEVRVFISRAGRIRVKDDVIVLRPSDGRSGLRDICRPELADDVILQGDALAPFRLGWSVEADPAAPDGRVLVIADETGRATGTYRLKQP